MQNPPSIPSLFVAWFVCRLRGSKFIIDWHNFGYTILKLSFHNNEKHICIYFISCLYINSLVVKIAKWIERFFGKKADYHICVTKAMKVYLLLFLLYYILIGMVEEELEY